MFQNVGLVCQARHTSVKLLGMEESLGARRGFWNIQDCAGETDPKRVGKISRHSGMAHVGPQVFRLS